MNLLLQITCICIYGALIGSISCQDDSESDEMNRKSLYAYPYDPYDPYDPYNMYNPRYLAKKRQDDEDTMSAKRALKRDLRPDPITPGAIPDLKRNAGKKRALKRDDEDDSPFKRDEDFIKTRSLKRSDEDDSPFKRDEDFMKKRSLKRSDEDDSPFKRDEDFMKKRSLKRNDEDDSPFKRDADFLKKRALKRSDEDDGPFKRDDDFVKIRALKRSDEDSYEDTLYKRSDEDYDFGKKLAGKRFGGGC